MSRNYKTIASLLLLTYTLNSCANKSDYLTTNLPKISQNSINKKFNPTDLYLLYALDASSRRDYKIAAEYFEKVYDEDSDFAYLDEAIKNIILTKDYDEIKRLIDKAIKLYPKNNDLKRYLAAYYIDKKDFKKAHKLLNELVYTRNDEKSKELLAITLLNLKKYDQALSFYENAYKESSKEKYLIKLSDILYFYKNEKDRAISLLEHHESMLGCGKKVCFKLLDMYARKRDISSIIKTYKKLYFQTQNGEFANRLLDTYALQKDYDSAIEFLIKTNYNDDLLLEIYLEKKDYTHALELVKRLYKSSKNPHYMARWAIIEYESNGKKNSKNLIEDVSKKFESVIDKLDDPLYFNYYGYILIEHDINISKGMELVKKALKKEPESIFYLDSLAWGYYKDNNCSQALPIMEKLIDKTEEKEIVEHYKKIQECQRRQSK